MGMKFTPEQKLLRLLVENRGRTMTRGDLVDRIWTDGAEYVVENALSVTIKRLRDKLGAQKYIKTVYGIGYSWVTKDEQNRHCDHTAVFSGGGSCCIMGAEKGQKKEELNRQLQEKDMFFDTEKYIAWESELPVWKQSWLQPVDF